MGVKASSSEFIPAQLYTMSHHLERAQHAAVHRGPETFTLLVLRHTCAPMEFQPPIPMGYEDRWLQTVSAGLGRSLGFSEAPAPTASKDPQEEHWSYRNWRLETSSAILEMGVSNNQKWGPPQYFWMKGRDWIIRQVVTHLTPKALAGVLRMEEERRSRSQPHERFSVNRHKGWSMWRHHLPTRRSWAPGDPVGNPSQPLTSMNG